MRTFIKGTDSFSDGRRALSRAMGVRQIRRTNSQYVPRPSDIILNWGSSNGLMDVTYINSPAAVCRATSKVNSYDCFRENDVPTVVYTTTPQTARHWLVDRTRVIQRRLDRGSQGRGMRAYSYEGTEHTRDYRSFCEADSGGFYVKVFGDVTTNKEYRVHVVDGIVIDEAQKRRRSGYEGIINPYIRSAGNGWVYCRRGVECSAPVRAAAIAAVAALGLDFGAVDIAEQRGGGVCVYEVNTAPGIEGSTVGKYATALGDYVAKVGGGHAGCRSTRSAAGAE